MNSWTRSCSLALALATFVPASASAAEGEQGSRAVNRLRDASRLNDRVVALVQAGDPQSLAELRRMLDAGVPPTTWLAMIEAVERTGQGHHGLVEIATHHRRAMVRARAFESLEKHVDTARFEVLARTLDDPEQHVRAVAYRLLMEEPDAQMELVLLEHVRRGEFAAVPALVACTDYQDLDQLLAEAQVPGQVRTRLLGELLMSGDLAVTPANERLLVDALEAVGTAESRDELWVFGHHWKRAAAPPHEAQEDSGPLELEVDRPHEVELVREDEVLDDDALDRLIVVEKWSQ